MTVMLSKKKGYRRITNSVKSKASYEFARIAVPYDAVTLKDIEAVPDTEWYNGNTVGYSYGATTAVFRHTSQKIYGKAMLIPSEWTSLGIFQIARTDGVDSWQMSKNRYSKATIKSISE